MTRMRSILLGAGTSLVLVLTSCSGGSPAGAGNSSGAGSSGSSAPAVAGNSPGGGSSAPAVAGNLPGGGSSGSTAPAVAGNSSVRDHVVGPGLVAVRSGTAATSVKETDYLKFVPASVNVKVGDIVVFTNGGVVPHNVTFPYAGIGSPTMKRGNSFLVKFTSPGTYQYVCTLHFSGMLGTITVR
jgi:plastocyanin